MSGRKVKGKNGFAQPFGSEMETPTINVVAPPSSAGTTSKPKTKTETMGKSTLSKLVDKINEQD